MMESNKSHNQKKKKGPVSYKKTKKILISVYSIFAVIVIAAGSYGIVKICKKATPVENIASINESELGNTDDIYETESLTEENSYQEQADHNSNQPQTQSNNNHQVANTPSHSTPKSNPSQGNVNDRTGVTERSGQCGDNAYWSIANNTLTISGSGRMYSYSSDNKAPWSESDVQKTYNKVVISSGITNIGSCAFYFCGNITSVSVPPTVTMFGSQSFYNCKSLRDITIPQGVKSIPDACFASCRALESINIPDSVQSFGMTAFQSTGIIEFTIPEGVTKITGEMFWNCNNLQKVTIPKSVTKIDAFAFHNCGITDIYYGGTQADFNRVKIDSLETYNEGLLTAIIHYS